MNVYPGQDWYKVRQKPHRLAQVSAVDGEYVFMYWPDKDIQTCVRRERLNRTTEWLPCPPVSA
jgi:hypothetical protein